jgi:hypothetical protein
MPIWIPTNLVRIVFEKQQSAIAVTLNEKGPRKFGIDADEKGCFISYREERIDADRLSELALEEALSTPPPAPKSPWRKPAPGTAWG